MKLLYTTLVDISQPTGPGTNELQSIIALERYKNSSDEMAIIVANPKSKKINLNSTIFSFSITNKVYKGFSLLLWQIQYLKQFIRFYYEFSVGTEKVFVIIRPDKAGKLFLIPIWLILKNIVYGLRHIQDQYDFSNKKSLKKTYKNYLLKIGLRRANYVDSALPERINRLSSISNRNIKIVKNAVNLERFMVLNKEACKRDIGIPSDRFVVGYIGGVPLDRGASELLNTVLTLRQQIPNIHILIVGDSKNQKLQHLAVMKEMVMKMGLQQYVTLTGIVPFEEIIPYFNALDIGVALVPNEEVLEKGNSSQKIYQYIACGVPVIVPFNTHKDLVSSSAAFETEPENFDRFVETILTIKNMAPDVEAVRKVALNYSVRQKAINQLNDWREAMM